MGPKVADDLQLRSTLRDHVKSSKETFVKGGRGFGGHVILFYKSRTHLFFFVQIKYTCTFLSFFLSLSFVLSFFLSFFPKVMTNSKREQFPFRGGGESEDR